MRLLRGLTAVWLVAFLTEYSAMAGHYAMAFWREAGAYENQSPPAGEFGNHSAHVHIWDANGQPLSGRQIYTSWGVLLGTTDANGYTEIVLNRPNGYDFQIRDGTHSTETTPILSVERPPTWGHYSFEIGFMFKQSAASPGRFDTNYLGTINASGTDPCQHLSAPHTRSLSFYSTSASNYCSDQYALGNWAASHGQTFVATGNRVIAMKALMAAGGDTHYNWTVQVLDGGPNGAAVGPPRTTRTVVDSEYYQLLVKWGANDVQVVPGRTYYYRISRDVGINAYRVNRNNYFAGNYFENGNSIASAELMGLVLCGTFTNSGPSGTLTGFVRNTSNVAIGGATVTINGAGLYTISAANGAYSIPFVPAGTYSVVAAKTGFIAQQSESVSIVANQATTLNFNLTQQPTNAGAITGVITDINSVALAGVRVTAYPTNLSTLSDSQGRYTLPAVLFGMYRLVASRVPFASVVTNNISITNGQTTIVDFQLAPALLQNGNIEEGFAASVANGWRAFTWAGGNGAAYVEETGNKLGGSRSQRWWTSFGLHHAGVFQQVPVINGQNYSFSAWTWRSDSFNNGGVNEETWVGVDPFGGTDPNAANVLWSSGQSSYQTWTRQTAATTARSSVMTVFVRGRAHFAGQAMQAAFDDAVLAGPAAFPPGLSASGHNRRVELLWYATAPGALYTVKRSTSPSGPFDIIGDFITETSYTDTDVSNDTTYYYVVASDGPDSRIASATPTASIPIVPAGATWKFLDNGSNQGTAWRAREFNDALWRSGPARLGYGNDGESTVVSYGSDANNKFRTTYFRHAFLLSDTYAYTNFILRLIRDDGGVVYLNSNEVFRSNMPAGAINYQTYASSAVGGEDEFRWFATNVSASLLRVGANVLAVEIHQNTNNSSDLGFDLQLIGQIDEAAPPRIAISADNGQVALTWPIPLDPFDLESSTSVDGVWQDAGETVLTSNNTARVVVSPLAPRRFYRLQRR